jgi:FG-GAP-like repeat
MKKIIFLYLIVIQWFACKNAAPQQNQTAEAYTPPQPTNKTGEELSTIYCGSCHAYPKPDLLKKEMWMQKCLPNMGSRLGIHTEGYNPMKGMNQMDQFFFNELKIYPQNPVLAQEDWAKIVTFYQNAAPKELPKQPSRLPVKLGLPFFNIKKPNFGPKRPLTTMSQVNEKNSELYIGTMDGQFLVINKQLQITDSFKLEAAPIAAFKKTDDIFDVITMGIMQPTEEKKGIFQSVYKQNPTANNPAEQIHSLHRPVDFIETDLNNDGKNELVICQFGYQTGKLAWYERPGNKWHEHVLSRTPGASKVFPYDFDKDGKMDLAVLFAQGDERVSIFYNKGEGVFEEKTALRFPPVYGSCDLQLVDFNKDGFMDLLYTNGDNADFSATLKPYHGVHVFLNDGKNEFKEAYFHPLYGAFQAAAADFDMDGDLDIVATSFFPETIDKPESSVLYLEQTKQMTFQPYTFKEAITGKWLTLDIGDLDHDGDIDIVLGSFMGYEMGPTPRVKYIDRTTPFLFLENKKR